ncbi:hypothetical protein A3E15_01855 [Candidatus Woesebacteria bacterium RIFCSPHIGHO2_12_FULL_42_9]|uniref:DDH domain-containing protein n=3 Tax=Candidatus Woeseibacteriota TaxID=1752722 RepID=A0A1F8AQL5_9BACT|nr:MAG: hypothetical protein UT23_C0020G0023 [Candidatus Woesebacteria bacterium GW2011_GWA1_39_12]OGM06410.1 MAG: hypothetical protein A2129_00585 [Candidatus Woesebacteria bacterium GWC1_42_13]OGM54063.1 MAG: hypothetical protein A3E15_01855 [Candidatus Woesebacteria bacterium RIFCSPHIGHO2_12_FULL_42_9]
MQDSFVSLINSSKSVLILLPTKPYLDQAAAGLALYLALREQKDVTIACPTPMTVEFNRLVGVNKVTADPGSKNMIIRFVDYNARNIERISSEVEGNGLYMVVIPNPGAKAPAKENVEISFSGVASDIVILVGGVNESHYPQLSTKDFMGTKLVHVGTRSLAISADKNILSFARPASSVSEVVASLIEEMGVSGDADIATNLLMGIEEGSRQFKGPDVTAETFELIATLLKKGGQRLPERVEKREFSPILQAPPVSTPQSVEEESPKEPPKDWLEPKIYKGTSIS